MKQKVESRKQAKRKFINPIRPSLFRTKKSNEAATFEDFLRENINNSINAKFLLGKTEFYNLEAFQNRFSRDLPLLKEIIVSEVNRPEGTFALYHGSSNAVKFFRMVISAIYRMDNLHTEQACLKTNMVLGCMKQRSFSPSRFFNKTSARMRSRHPLNSSSDFSAGKEFDHEDHIRKHLLCASMLLHDGYYGETSWLFFQNNKSISVRNEEKFLEVVLNEFCKKQRLDNFPVEELIKLYSGYKQILQAQLLQIFINQNDFNELGYYCYAGGAPLVRDSGSFMNELFAELTSQNSDNWQRIVTEKINNAFKANKLHPLIDKEPSSQLMDEWLNFLQVRFITTNPEFYNTDKVTINEYYRSDEAYSITKDLKKELRILIESYFAQKQTEQQLIPM
ncbi:hypothetical protein A8135_11395 [Legionella jamestowniensis]|uniref:Uncharacterized protein n=2 Tax=Legionella jamestowniensis TaxID=455 RepID=A0ABX2XU77_9GAMM|nr:hypothetical protein [Legionella jamestowniensis]OCH98169.1 hypothetical protein A8135_11395 [Legionella jamestowniensis]SFL80070.1 hypothetical protein SAMN02746073_2029 [Legionella jamestowniensis DSM 19215]